MATMTRKRVGCEHNKIYSALETHLFQQPCALTFIFVPSLETDRSIGLPRAREESKHSYDAEQPERNIDSVATRRDTHMERAAFEKINIVAMMASAAPTAIAMT